MSSPDGRAARIATPEMASSINRSISVIAARTLLCGVLSRHRADHLGDDLQDDHIAPELVRGGIWQHGAKQFPSVTNEPEECALVLVGP